MSREMRDNTKPLLLCVGLGNYGKKYYGTRHNVGFHVVDAIAKQSDVVFSSHKKLSAETAHIHSENGTSILLCKSLTYMNVSGNVLSLLCNYFKVAVENVIVIVDNKDLAVGTVRMKNSGGDSSHNGLRSISLSLGTGTYGRMYIGIGSVEGRALSNYVLSAWHSTEDVVYQKVFSYAAKCILRLQSEDFSIVQQDCNGMHIDA